MKDLKRVILKLSGEALTGNQKSGYDDAMIEDIARQVKEITDREFRLGSSSVAVITGEDVLMTQLTERKQTRLECLQQS